MNAVASSSALTKAAYSFGLSFRNFAVVHTRLNVVGPPRTSEELNTVWMPGRFKRKHALRLPWLAERKALTAEGGQVMGCNMGMWRKDLDLVSESVRRAVRAAANEVWGKKPLVTVFVTR